MSFGIFSSRSSSEDWKKNKTKQKIIIFKLVCVRDRNENALRLLQMMQPNFILCPILFPISVKIEHNAIEYGSKSKKKQSGNKTNQSKLEAMSCQIFFNWISLNCDFWHTDLVKSKQFGAAAAAVYY